MKNPQLGALEQKLESQIPPGSQKTFSTIVGAGMKVLFSPQTHDHIFAGAMDGNIPMRLAVVVVGVFKMLQQESKGMPMDIGMLALVDLYLHVLDMAASAGRIQITPAVLKAGLEALGRLVQQQLVSGAQAQQSAQSPPAPGAPAAQAPAPQSAPVPAGGPPAQPAAPAGGIVAGGMQA